MSIFQKKTGFTDYFDQITVALYSFDVAIRVRHDRGDPSAIHCGRIVTFELSYEGEFVTYFDDGEWLIPIEMDRYDAEFYDCAVLARDLMIQKWSNPERIREKTTKTDLF